MLPSPPVMEFRREALSGRSQMMEAALVYWLVGTQGDVAQFLFKAEEKENPLHVLSHSHPDGNRQDSE